MKPEQVVRTTVVGNPIMIHILHGLNPQQLAMAPYIPLVSGLVRRPPEEFGWSFQGCGWVETLPLISAFVGADTVGMILALDLEHEEQTTLSIDIGTNGEMVLVQGGGAPVHLHRRRSGLRGRPDRLRHARPGGGHHRHRHPPDGELELAVVGGGRPKGICGSGLISGIAELLEAGACWTPAGACRTPEEVARPELAARLFRQEKMLAFRLSDEVYITQRDIRELQLAKGAIRTGHRPAAGRAGVSPEGLARIRLAGNFGSGLDIRKTIRLGLIPGLPAGEGRRGGQRRPARRGAGPGFQGVPRAGRAGRTAAASSWSWPRGRTSRCASPRRCSSRALRNPSARAEATRSPPRGWKRSHLPEGLSPRSVMVSTMKPAKSRARVSTRLEAVHRHAPRARRCPAATGPAPGRPPAASASSGGLPPPASLGAYSTRARRPPPVPGEEPPAAPSPGTACPSARCPRSARSIS